jgi:4-amino-4-deoxy-L-arabinose transferase-like glycosyltransferase
MTLRAASLSVDQVRLAVLHGIILIPLALFLAFYKLDAGANLGTGTGIDESWYIQVAQEMKASGKWWLPTREGEPFFYKPPLNFWLTALSSEVLGNTIASYRVVGAAVGVAFVALAYLVGAALFTSLNAGFCSALVLLSTKGFLFLNGIRFATLDTLVTFLSALALLVMYRAVSQGPELAQSGQRRLGLVAGGLLGLAVLTKSVLGYYVYGIFGLWFLLFGKSTVRRALELKSFFFVTVAISIIVPALWFLPHMLFTPGAWHRMVGYELISRFGNGLHNSSNWLLYWDSFKAQRYLPFYTSLAAVAFCLLRSIYQRDRSLALFVIWAVVPFLVFTALSSRLVWYVAPCYFPGAILCGGFIGLMIDRGIACSLTPGGQGWAPLRRIALGAVSLMIVGVGGWETVSYLAATATRVIQGSPRLAIDELVHELKTIRDPVRVISYSAPSLATRERIFPPLLQAPHVGVVSNDEAITAANQSDAYVVFTSVDRAPALLKALPFAAYRYLPPVTFPQGPGAVYREDGLVAIVGARKVEHLEGISLKQKKVVLKLLEDGRTCHEIFRGRGQRPSQTFLFERGAVQQCQFEGDPLLHSVRTKVRLNLGLKLYHDAGQQLSLQVYANYRLVGVVDSLRRRIDEYSFSVPAGAWSEGGNSVYISLVERGKDSIDPHLANQARLLMRWAAVDLDPQ